MIKGQTRFLLLLAMLSLPLLLAMLSPSLKAGGETLSAAEQRGQHIYLKGTSPRGKDIVAAYGRDGEEVVAAILPCVNCHGHDGRGRPEGGVLPSNINWLELTKPYGSQHPRGRKALPYTEASLKRAIAMGLDSAGNPLDPAMPRFAMTLEDMADLIAFLKKVGQNTDPGLSDARVRVGVVLPPQQGLEQMNRAISAALQAQVAELNRRGLYHRQLELVFRAAAARPDARSDAFRALIQEDEVFVLLAGFMAGDEADVARLLGEKRVPLVGAFTRYPEIQFPLNRQIFYVSSGVPEQARALLHFAASLFGEKRPPLALLAADLPIQQHLAQELEQQSHALGWAEVNRVTLRDEDLSLLVQQLRLSGVVGVVHLGGSRLAGALLEEAHNQGWHPHLFLPDATGDLPAQPSAVKVYTAVANLPPQQQTQEWASYRTLAQTYKLPNDFVDAQLEALTSLKLLAEGLSRAGRELSREKLVEALEGIYQYPTGLTPALSYGPNRRIGAQGAYILRLDPAQKAWVTVSDWIESGGS